MANIVRFGSKLNQRIYLYKDGVELVSWTGQSGRLSKQSDHILYSNPSDTATNETLTLSTVDTIPAGLYSKFGVEVEIDKTGGSNHSTFAVRLAIAAIEGPNTFLHNNHYRKFEHLWDISDRAGSNTFRVRFYCWGQTGTIKVRKIWLEK